MEVAESIGARLAKAAVAATFDGAEVDLAAPVPDGTALTVITADSDAGRAVIRALHRPRARPGGAPAVAGRPLRHRPGHRGRLLLRLRTPRWVPLQRRRPRAHRGHHARDHGRGPAVHPSRAHHRPGALPLRGPALQAGDHRGGRRRRRRGGRHRRGGLHRPRLHLLELSGVHRSVPRTSCPLDQPARSLRPHAGGRGLLAGRREAPTAPTHLRNGVGVGEGPGCSPAPPGGGRAPRPPQARRRVGPLLLPRRDRIGPGRVPSQGRHRPAGDGGVFAYSATRPPATSSSTRPTSPRRNCSRPRAISTGSPRGCSRPWSSTAGSSTTSSR